MDHFWQGIEGCFTFAEFYAWIAESARETWRGVEVGALYGQSAAFLAVCLDAHTFAHDAKLDLVELSDNGPTIRFNLDAVKHIIGAVHSPMSSIEASAKYAKDSIDFVMLDAGHDYSSVREDIDAWWPKIKPGGILSGHDFSHYFPGVMRAALESFPRLQVWAGSEWPDATVHGQRLSDAQNDIRNRSALQKVVDFMPVFWVRK